MAKMVSAAGDMEVRMLGFSREGNKLVVISEMGVWDSRIYFTPREALHVSKLMLNWAVIGYVIALPFIYLSTIIRHEQEE